MGFVIHQVKIDENLAKTLMEICPFEQIFYENCKLEIGAGCKLCKLCVKNSNGAIEFVDEKKTTVDKSSYSGILVFVEQTKEKIHQVTFELLNKASELAIVINQPVYALMIGKSIAKNAEDLFSYGADRVFSYEADELENFLIEPYSSVFEDFIIKYRPTAVLVGATNIGRSLAPRVAAHFKTGLTADCTALEMKKNTDLVQIRPAFGGNIMARIVTPNKRPQMCTVRYKIFDKGKKREAENKVIEHLEIEKSKLISRAIIKNIIERPIDRDISEADRIVACGRGIKKKSDILIIEKLCKLLGAQIACTRPLMENGWFNAKQQIGLSGRTVKPKLLITIGISGSVQFVAGAKGSECIIAINSDPNAQVFDVANYSFVGDLYEIITNLIEKIEDFKNVQ
ncbi:electron transfer flavoprotein subunit alpha/FixB family protein [Clostridium sp.]|uniref:electron transfer flavoprotein subunit alpha/FixB family protein n=1 Tax=Clostridium sp. TaxID=1506 RepID=UPI001A51C1C7|nr:electron transfer flavoprotein subunit alpha/FixB family protein [Clostridium sp.]MBK5242951.1 electron transfer flavoprotein subunit alpha/FixB family protein [Clostridium sp.]